MSVTSRVIPLFPASVVGGSGITVTKSNGTYTISLTGGAEATVGFLYGANHGIVADGSTDNATALAALQALAIAQSKVVVLPPGVVYTTQNFTLTGHLTMIGLGRRLTTFKFGSGTGILTGQYTIELSGLNVETSGIGVSIGDDANDNYHSIVAQCNFSNCGTGIKATNGQITRILECGFGDFTDQGILITAPLNSDAGDCLIDGCYFAVNSGASGGTTKAAIFHHSGGGWKITNNKTVGGNRGYWHKADYTNAFLSSSSLIINDNSFEGNAVAGIVIESASTIANDLYNVVISGNQTGGEQAGIEIVATGGRQWVHGAVIESNRILMDVAPAPGYSIDGVSALSLRGGSVSSTPANDTAVVIGSHSSGIVDLPTIDNFTTSYTNGSSPDVTVLNTAAAAWSDYTPVITASSGTFGSVTATGRFQEIGKTIHVQIQITDTTNGTAAGAILATLPVITSNISTFYGTETTGLKGLSIIVGSGSNQIGIVFYDATYPGADGRAFTISGTYERP